ncbi:heme peroxidase, partial [Exidia glandulosa HHB12029]
MSTRALLALATAASSVRAAVHIWPNPHLDTLEFLRFDTINMGNSIPTFASESRTTNDADGKNRNNAADWIRTAYHDMATYNIEDGTGGLDASIQFEMDRDENPGDGFSNTITFFQSLYATDDDVAQYVSLADLIALGLVSALEMNDGPSLPFRGGRIDATEANAPGVPNPTQSVEEHTASFARQGFNATEMIELIACGHSFGGVQNAAFPLVVDKVDGSAQGNVPFDSTPLHFDNNIATEFLDGTTQNPLVVSKNVSALSDARIFASDGNVTISA